MPRKGLPTPITLSEADRAELQRWVNADQTPQPVSQRCQIILAAADGTANRTIAKNLRISRNTVALWRRRFLDKGVACLWEVTPSRGGKRKFSDEKIEAIVKATLETHPPGATRWSGRTLAKQQRVSRNTIYRIWKRYHLKPHLENLSKSRKK